MTNWLFPSLLSLCLPPFLFGYLDGFKTRSRAVYINSSEDAAAYFNQAVELASRFGDEIVQRWEAVTSLAKRTYRAEYHNDNLAYRYIRCAELVGEHVAREKYWNRNEAISTCINLSPSTAIAALSRWRDREVGRFYLQIHALAYELVLNGHASPMEVWSLTAFYEDYYYVNLAILCIDTAIEREDKRFIFESAIHAMQIAECSNQDWIKLKDTADKYSLTNEQLEYIVNAYSNAEDIPITEYIDSSFKSESIASVFDGIDLVSQDGIREIYRRHKLIERQVRNNFREELFIRIPQQRIAQFLHLYLDSECVNVYDAVAILEKAKNTFTDKYSLQREWDKYLYKFGHRFPCSLVSYRSFEYFTEKIAVNEHDRQVVKNAVIRGFADHGAFTDADTCFGFVANVVEFITHEQAEVLLDYSLNRFELFIDDNFGDGPYENNRLSSDIVADSIAGFIWCALGSPHSETRWRAVHSVKLLADTKSHQVFDSLVSLLQSDRVGIYGYSGYPFYKMHAKQYLLIALLRIAVDDANLIYPHRKQIEDISKDSHPHILMQKISSDICIALEIQYPNTYKKEEIARFQTISQSPFPVEDRIDNNYKNSYLHEANEINVPDNYHHSFFFEDDWFKPLGTVFGISSKQVTELATDMLINDWGYPHNEEYERDPRDFQWQRGSLTHHSHGTYPRSDDYSFYLSYHAMLGVASKLLKHMPSVRRFEDEDPWEYWFAQHYLTRNDGRWISDRRDPAPLRQHNFDSMKTDWEMSVNEEMIFDGLCNENFYGSFTTVYGWSEDGNSSLSETYHVSSAFIPVETTEALVYALCSFESPHDYRFPTYNEECDEDENPVLDEKFSMIGWIVDSDRSKRIDEYDPFAADISYPPYLFGESFTDMMNLSADSEHRFWLDKNSGRIKALCEIWCSNVENPMKDTPFRKGMKMSLDYQAIVQLCKQLNKNLLVEVTLKHSLKREHYDYEKNREYRPPEARLYVICKDGTVKQSTRIGRSYSKRSK
jgi:hypothetical protein